MSLTKIAERFEDSFEKRHLVHKRLERWIRLQQFVYGLPEDYSYAVCTREVAGGFESRALVKVGGLTWFGVGRSPNSQQALAVALLETGEAVSANGTRTFLHGLRSWWKRLTGRARARQAPKEEPREERLAG